jgi:hypothetical protein
LGRDPGRAREHAKARALGDLARNVRVTVRSAMIDVLGESAGRTRRELESRVDAYAALPPTTLDREDYFLHHPARGQIACRVALNRARYDESVRRDLAVKTARVLDHARAAAGARRDGRPADALTELAALRERADTDLPGLPIQGDPTGTGRTVDVVAWARAEADAWSADAALDVSSGPYIHDARGRGAAPVDVRFRWRGAVNRRVDGLALQAVWSHRPGRPAGRATTDDQGRAVFTPAVDPFFDAAELAIGLDPAVWGATRPALGRAAFHRRRSVRLDVRCDRADVARFMTEVLTGALKRLDWDVATAVDSTESGEDYEWRWEASVRTSKHPDAAIHSATIETRASLQRRRDGVTLVRGPGPSALGRGASPADALRAALEEGRARWAGWALERSRGLP